MYIPIADKVLSFYKSWYESSECEYLLHTEKQSHFTYNNYKDSYRFPLMEALGMDRQPHDARHTITMRSRRIRETVGALHHHPHTQITYVVSGVFEFEIDGVKKTVRAGVLLDIFNPIREDFV